MSKPIEQMWDGFAKMVVPASAPEVQRVEMRKAFYAGASALFTLMVKSMSDGPDEMPEDMALMENIQSEIDEFRAELDREVIARRTVSGVKS